MGITTTWTEDSDEVGTWRFPTVHLEHGMTWRPYHSVGAFTDEIDAVLLSSTGQKLGLDMWGFAAYAQDECEDDDILVGAIKVWDDGGVFHGTYGLIIPDPVIDNFEEALRRFTP